jgi:carboxylesterase 3/5
VVDGVFFPEEPLELLSKKTFEAIPSIIGVNNHECGFLLPMVRILAVLPAAPIAMQLFSFIVWNFHR